MSEITGLSKYDLTAILPGNRSEVRTAITSYVQRVAAEFADAIVSITLYGSYARGEARSDSDIDLFIVVRSDTPELRQDLADLAWQVQYEHDVVISDIIRSLDQLHRLQLEKFPYYQSIKREGILLWKNPHEHMLAYV